MKKPAAGPFSAGTVKAAWERALSFWGLAIQKDAPRLDPGAEGLAFIDLSSRELTVNTKRLAELKAEGSLPAVFAHELGHHVRYPHSLSTQARLELLEKEILPFRSYSLLNLFTDYLINTELAREKDFLAQMAAVYRGTPAPAEAMEQDPAFWFYLTCFEEAWGLEPRTLTREAGEALERRFPGARAEAQLLAEEVPNLAPNLFTQFLYFASVVSRYQVVDPEKDGPGDGKSLNPGHGDYSKPSAGDYADALERTAAESEAIRKAIEKGWLKPERIGDTEASRQQRAAGLPGVLAGEPRKLAEAMAIRYRRLAERHLVPPPRERRAGDPLVPSTLSEWDPSDSPREIDWTASILALGPDLAAAAPLRRDLLPDDGGEAVVERPVRLELYLDVSGSMPDPKAALNPMTLGAQVLATSAIRGGGQVRALIYSTNNVRHWAWTRNEMEVSRFLMTYIGGGTDFPFDVLSASVRECGPRQPIRCVLTDSDFSYNLKARESHGASAREAASKGTFVALLNGSRGEEAWVKEIGATGIVTVPVATMAEFPAAAAALGEKLFGTKAAPSPRTGGRRKP